MSTTHHIYLFTIFILISYASAQDSNHYFCGTSWGDASDNCKERQHCPSGSDDECDTEGHICFGDTTCDVTKGDGNLFKYANVPYEDISNTRFCGAGWTEAAEKCSVDTHCPSGFSDECPDGQQCYGGLSDCNVKDFFAEIEEEKAASGGGSGANGIIAKHDARRNNFCGNSWGDANQKCSIWCPEGDDTDCPGGLGCFAETECYYSADLIPTQTPVRNPTIGPSTMPPFSRKDPGNVMYCGASWADAVANCSIETNCPSGSE